MCGCRPRDGDTRWRVRGAVSPALLLLLLVALADADFDGMSPVPFLMGARYGRSSGPKVVSSRSDRFFVPGRYGKRSEEQGPQPTQQPPGAPRLFEGVMGEESGAWDAPGARQLMCEFTGVSSLYRCVRHNKRDHYDARIGDESGMEEVAV